MLPARDWPPIVRLSALAMQLFLACELCRAAEPTTADGPGTETMPSISFENDIEPLLSRLNCNSSGCHGKAEGQNGFKLSVFGFDPDADHRAIVSEARGRRVFPPSPDRSLLLLKASGGLPHGGGVRTSPESDEYKTLRNWIATGLPRSTGNEARLTGIQVSPSERVLQPGDKQQLRVVATWSDGRTQDVTRLARFQANHDGFATVDEHGLVTTREAVGVVAIMASFLGEVDIFQGTIPRPGPQVAAPSAEGTKYFIDELIDRRLQQLNLASSPRARDEDFLRRAYLDLIGTLPTPEEVRSFLASSDPARREKLIDALLARDEFNDYWAMKLADVLRIDRQAIGHKGAHQEYQWLRRSLEQRTPLDELARELITADGPLAERPAGYFYKTAATPGKQASALSQSLLGIRLECAECHHHPYDRWSQTDYYGFAAYFAPLRFKPSKLGEAIVVQGEAAAKHPRTGQPIAAHALGTPAPEKAATGDQRAALAAWLTSPENPYFARNWANRLWAHMLGRGLVEPVDDVRATNPPSNPALLDALAKNLCEQEFDLRGFLRTIANSQTYQRSSEPNATNSGDEQNYSRFLFKRLEAEVLLDALCQTTGVPEKFEGMPAGLRATELWDSQVDHDFLKMFGRPTRQTVCECERVVEPSVAQVFHLLNSERVQEKLARDDGRLAALVAKSLDDSQLVDDLYVTFLSRRPTADELARGLKFLQAGEPNERLQRAEDLAWSLLNSLEFVFNH